MRRSTMPRKRKQGLKTSQKTSAETAEDDLLIEHDDNVTKALEEAGDLVVDNSPSLMGMLYGDLPPAVVWKILYLVNRQVTVEEKCTLLSMFTDYMAGECVHLGLLDSGNKYNRQSYVLLEELANAWDNILQQRSIIKDKKLLNSLISNLRKSVSTLATYGFQHYFSRTLDIVHKHECNEPVDKFFSFSASIPRQYSIPEYKVRRILSVREEFRGDLYSQDTARKPVMHTQKKPTWVNFDMEWIPSDDDLEMTDSDYEFDVMDSDSNRDMESPSIETIKNWDDQVTEHLRCISDSVLVSSSNIDKKNSKYAVEEQRELKEKENNQENDVYKEMMKDNFCSDNSQCSSSTSFKRNSSPPRSRVLENRHGKKRPRDWDTDDSDYSLSPIKRRMTDSPQRCPLQPQKIAIEKNYSYNFPGRKLEESNKRHKEINLAKQQTRKNMLKAIANDSDSSLPDLDAPDISHTKPKYITLPERRNPTLKDENDARYKRKKESATLIKEDIDRFKETHFRFQPSIKEDYCSRPDEFTSFYDYSSDDNSICSSDYSNCKAQRPSKCGKKRFHESRTNKRGENHQDVIGSPAKRIKHNSSLKKKGQEDHVVEINGNKKDNRNKILDLTGDTPVRKSKVDLLGNVSKEDKKPTHRSRTHIIHGKDSLSPGDGGRHRGKCSSFALSIPSPRKFQEFSERSSERPEKIKPSLHSDPYKTPEIPKCNTMEKGKELLLSIPAVIRKKSSKARNQDIRNFFNSCSR